MNAPPPKPDTIDLNTIQNEPETKTPTQNIHIIVGSFSYRENANALLKQLKNRGFSNARIAGTNERGLIRVSVESFYTEEEVDLALVNIRLKLSSAWVLNNNKGL